jgi:hypothetical protein
MGAYRKTWFVEAYIIIITKIWTLITFMSKATVKPIAFSITEAIRTR